MGSTALYAGALVGISAADATCTETAAHKAASTSKRRIVPTPHLSIDKSILLDYATGASRACLQLGGLCARTDQNQTRNIVLLCSAAGTLGIHKSVAQRLMRGRHYGGPTHAALWIARRPMGADKGFFARP